MKGTISRQGKPTIHFEQSVTNLSAGEDREVGFTPEKFPELVVKNPDLWWPYTMGEPGALRPSVGLCAERIQLFRTVLTFALASAKSRSFATTTKSSPEIGKGGNFYLQVNGRDFLVRGGDYTPDLLYRYDPEREADILRYVKDLGINFFALGIENIQRAHCRTRRRAGHSAHVRLDVLQPVGKMEPVERRRPPRRAGKSCVRKS